MLIMNKKRVITTVSIIVEALIICAGVFVKASKAFASDKPLFIALRRFGQKSEVLFKSLVVMAKLIFSFSK